jgi:hypothetical protein
MISPEDAARALLVSKADRWFWGLIGSTIVLLVGVVMEEWEPLERFHTHNVNTRTRTRTPRTLVIRSQWAWKKLGVGLVILGIAGEGFCEFFGAKAETAVRNFDNGMTLKAQEEAGNAETSANGAASAAMNAIGASAVAMGLGQEANNEAVSADTSASNALTQAGIVTTQVAAVEAKRAELEKALGNLAVCNAPRVIPLWIRSPPTESSVEVLWPFKEFNAIIEFVPEFEAAKAARNIADALTYAKWTVVSVSPVFDIPEGVSVQPYEDRRPREESEKETIYEERLQQQYEERSQNAAIALIKLLHSYSWEASRGHLGDNDRIPPNTVRIRVGLYPAAPITVPGTVTGSIAEQNMRFEEKTQQALKEDMERLVRETNEELAKGSISPKDAAERIALFEDSIAEEQQPCRPLKFLTPAE